MAPLEGSTVFAAGVWQYVAVTFDGLTLTLYVDGAREAMMNTHDPGIGDQGHHFVLGAVAGTAGLAGDFGNLAAWTVARSAPEAWQAPWAPVPTSGSGLVASFDFGQAPPRDVAQSNPVTLSSGAVTQTVVPALILDGSGYADPSDESELNIGASPFTVEAWVCLDYPPLSGTQYIFANGNVASGSGVALSVGSGGFNVQLGTRTLMGLTKLTENTWYDLAATFDGQQLSLYIDGKLDHQYPFSAPTPLPAADVLIGAARVDTQPSFFLTGAIGFVTVWNKALTAAELQQWMYEDPSYQTGLAANFSFVVAPPEDTMHGHSVTLQQGASLGERRSTVTTWPPPGAELRPDPPTPSTLPPAPEPPPFVLGEAAPDLLEEIGGKLLAEIDANAPASASPELLTALRAEVEEAVAQARTTPLSQLGAGYAAYERDGEEHVFVWHGPSGSYEIDRFVDPDLTECQIWAISFFSTLLSGVAGMYGFTTPTGKLTSFALELWADPGFQAEIRTLLGVAMSASFVLGSLKLIYDFGYLEKFAWFLISMLTWYKVGQYLLKLAALCTPPLTSVVTAEFIAKAATLVLQLTAQYLGIPTGPGYQQACNTPPRELKAA